MIETTDRAVTLQEVADQVPELQAEIEGEVVTTAGEWRGLEIAVADFCDAGSAGKLGIVTDRDTGRQVLRYLAAGSKMRRALVDARAELRAEVNVHGDPLGSIQAVIDHIDAAIAKAEGKDSGGAA